MMALTVWDPEPMPDGRFRGLLADQTTVYIEQTPLSKQWDVYAWSADGRLIYRTDRFHKTVDQAKQHAEAWASRRG